MNKHRTSKKLTQREHNRDRMRRAGSWLERGIQAGERLNDGDDYALDYERFIFLWIAFNAVYDVDENKYEQKKIEGFLRNIIGLDGRPVIRGILETHADAIKSLLANRYASRSFWYKVGAKFSGYFTWYGRGHGQNIYKDLTKLFDPLYQIRNQIFHGNMTYATGWGRNQVREACDVMAALMPEIVRIMEDDLAKNPGSQIWGRLQYPNINKRRDDS